MSSSGKPIDRNVMREVNQNTLLNLVRLHAPVSRAQLVALSGLSVGTVVGIISELLKRQIIIEQGIADSVLGRKAGLLELHPEGGYVVGLSLVEENTVAAVLLNLAGEIVCSDSWRAELRNQGEHVVEMLAMGVESFLSTHSVLRSKILGLGCGLPGYVNAQTGYSIDNWIHNWHHLAISQPLAQQVQFPVYIDNIMNCLGSYEKLFGRGKHYQHFLVVTLGRGIGMAIIVNGELYRGAHNGGGELGHIPCVPDGRLCECGNRGCLEAYVADHGLLATYREVSCLSGANSTLSEHLTLSEVHVLAKGGNGSVLHIFEQAGRFLGTGLATMVNIFNPECIILTGVDMESHQLMFAAMQTAFRSSTFSSLGENLPVMIEPVLDTRWAQGAGCLVLRHFFGSPL